MKIFIAAAAILAGTLLSTTAADGKVLKPLPEQPYSKPRQIGHLRDSGLTGVSGMAASRRRPDILWVINDSGNGSMLYAIGLDGNTRGVFRVSGSRNWDWEDLASYTWGGKAYLVIGDVGDNAARRRKPVLYIVEEPEISPASSPVRGEVSVSRDIPFSYEDGPRDCEAVAVDLPSERILLLSKRDLYPRLYELPLMPAKGEGKPIARFLAEMTSIPPPSEEDLLEDPIFGRFRSQPTAMDIDPSGRVAIILTYGHAYRYDRAPTELWEMAFSKSPWILKLPRLKQAEALCIGYDGQTVFVTSERQPPSEPQPAPLLRIDRINDKIVHPPNMK